MSLQFWFEFGSTYSYPAAMRIETLAAQRGIAITWRPFLLGPIFREQGWVDSPFDLYPAKGQYMWRDLERICQAQNLALKMRFLTQIVALQPSSSSCWRLRQKWGAVPNISCKRAAA